MYGVVLWSDLTSGEAVIWCEDHGDLAFYREPEPGAEFLLGAGDLVRFDLTMDRQFRYANNPILVQDKFSDGLAEALSAAADAQPAVQDAPDSPQAQQTSARIIPFDRARAEILQRRTELRQRG